MDVLANVLSLSVQTGYDVQLNWFWIKIMIANWLLLCERKFVNE